MAVLRSGIDSRPKILSARHAEEHLPTLTVVIPVPPGPRPKSKCSGEYHVRLNEEQKKIIDDMGVGKPLDKILYLINTYGERRRPKNKYEIISKLCEKKRARKELDEEITSLEGILINEFEMTLNELIMECE